MYEYLKKYRYGLPESDCLFNCFFTINEPEIIQAEKELGYKFPNELRIFYEEIGYGDLSAPQERPDDYKFYGKNTILPPQIISNFKKGILTNHDLEYYMMEDVYEDLEPGDLPVFEIGDSTRFLIMRPLSDHPNAVYTLSNIKIEDSFAQFIYRLYHESPTYYADNW